MRHLKTVLLFVAAAWFVAGPAWAQTAAKPDDKQAQAMFDAMRKDLRKEKQSYVDQAMNLDAAQKSQFWAIYKDYQTALDKIWDMRYENIKKYADTIDNMTDPVADQLAVKMMDLESQRSALRKKYYAAIKEKMGARTAARFLQVETTLAYLIDLQLAADIPIIQ
jgi:hypothetical protein